MILSSYALDVMSHLLQSIQGSAVVFLHGFLGTGGDWIPIMKAISSSTRCIAVDLPGHGGSKLQYHSDNDSDRPNLSIDVVTDVLCKVLNNLTPEKVTLVGYSMGARISLYTALKRSEKVYTPLPTYAQSFCPLQI